MQKNETNKEFQQGKKMNLQIIKKIRKSSWPKCIKL